MRLVRFFCSVMEDDLLVSSGTRAFREQPLVNDRQTGQGMASHRWGESAQLRSGNRTPPSYLRCFIYLSTEFQYPISRILNQACSTSKNLLSYIFFASYWAESSNSPPGAWARDRQLPHRWDSFIFQQCCMFSELTMTLRRLARCRRLWSTAANTEVCGHWTSQLLQSPKGHLNVSPIPVFPSFASSSVHFIIFSQVGEAIWGFGLGQSCLFGSCRLILTLWCS